MRQLSCVSTDGEASDFPEARQLIKTRNDITRKKDNKQESATRHFVTSLSASEANPERSAHIIRSHWTSESRHWQRDACWGEDRCRLRNANAACALALLRTTLQTLVTRAGRRSLPEVFEDVAADLSIGLNWLNKQRFQR